MLRVCIHTNTTAVTYGRLESIGKETSDGAVCTQGLPWPYRLTALGRVVRGIVVFFALCELYRGPSLLNRMLAASLQCIILGSCHLCRSSSYSGSDRCEPALFALHRATAFFKSPCTGSAQQRTTIKATHTLWNRFGCDLYCQSPLQTAALTS